MTTSNQEMLAHLKTPCTIFFCHKEKELNENDTFNRNWLYVIYDVCGDEISIIKLFIMLMYINLGVNQLLKSVKSSAKFPPTVGYAILCFIGGLTPSSFPVYTWLPFIS